MADAPAFASSAPVFSVNGSRAPDLARDAVRLDIEETTDGLRTFTAQFLGSAPRDQPSTDVVEYLDGTLLDFGKRLEVSLGPPGNEKIVFTGVVSALEVSFTEGDVPAVVVSAEDDLMKLRLTQRSATYSQVSDADIVQRIASGHGLSAQVDADGPTYDVVQQFNQSDLAFLRARAHRIQAELWATEGSLHLATRDRRPGTSVTMTRGSDLISVSAKADLAEQCTAVRVSGYDARPRGPRSTRRPRRRPSKRRSPAGAPARRPSSARSAPCPAAGSGMSRSPSPRPGRWRARRCSGAPGVSCGCAGSRPVPRNSSWEAG